MSVSLLPAEMTFKIKYGDTKLIQDYTRGDGQIDKQKKYILKADK